MKAISITLTFLIFTSSWAQTIELNDTLFTDVSQDYYVCDSLSSNFELIEGDDAVWDYSTITGYDSLVYENTIIGAGESSYLEFYPMAKYSEFFEGIFHSFFSNSHTESYTMSHGFVAQQADQELIIVYNEDPMISLIYPMNFGEYYEDSVSGYVILPIVGETEIAGNAVVEADGRGTLIVNEVNHENVLRVHTIETIIGSAFDVEFTIRRESYVYYEIDEFQMPIFLHVTVGATFPEISSTRVYSVDQPIVDGDSDLSYFESDMFSNVMIYPNPSINGVIKISTADNIKSVRIVSLEGSTLYFSDSKGSGLEIDATIFDRGMYVVLVETDQSISNHKILIK